MLVDPIDYKKMIGDKKDHFKDVDNAAIQPIKKVVSENFSTDYKDDFIKASKDFWNTTSTECSDEYSKGDAVGKFTERQITLDSYFTSFFNCFKYSIISEFNRKNLTTEEIKLFFDAIETNIVLLREHIKKLNITLDVNHLAAFLQGFANSYISNVIKEKLENEKR